MRNLSVLGVLTLAVAGAAVAAPRQAACPAGASSSAVVVAPSVFRSIGDRYNNGVNPIGNIVIGTADPCPTGRCFPDQPQCAPNIAAGGFTIARAAYVGSLESPTMTGDHPDSDVNDIVAFFAFDASQLAGRCGSCYLRVSNAQNFLGRPYRLAVKVLENTGRNAQGGNEAGARGLFQMTGPFSGSSAGFPGSLATAVSDGRGERADSHQGHAQIPGLGPTLIHETCPAAGSPNDVYVTFDRSYDVPLGNICCDVDKAIAEGVSYNSCRYSCSAGAGGVPGTIAAVDCTLPVSNPIYFGITAVDGSITSNEHLQDTLLTDNLIHLMGDCDFAGEDFPGQTTRVDLVCD